MKGYHCVTALLLCLMLGKGLTACTTSGYYDVSGSCKPCPAGSTRSRWSRVKLYEWDSDGLQQRLLLPGRSSQLHRVSGLVLLRDQDRPPEEMWIGDAFGFRGHKLQQLSDWKLLRQWTGGDLRQRVRADAADPDVLQCLCLEQAMHHDDHSDFLHRDHPRRLRGHLLSGLKWGRLRCQHTVQEKLSCWLLRECRQGQLLDLHSRELLFWRWRTDCLQRTHPQRRWSHLMRHPSRHRSHHLECSHGCQHLRLSSGRIPESRWNLRRLRHWKLLRGHHDYDVRGGDVHEQHGLHVLLCL